MSLSSFLGLEPTESDKKIRYAVVGLGDISQAAMLPGIKHTGNSEVTAFVTGDPEKAKDLKKMYNVEYSYTYEEFPQLLASGQIDAIYLATPNWLHADFAVPALKAGIHVLLEKPMEISSAKCQEILDAAKASTAKLMVAYRLHFEPATLSTIQKIRDGEIGELRIFNATFSQLVDPKNHRAKNGALAGPLFDMGPYPISAARYVFGDEPTEVIAAFAQTHTDAGFDANVQDTVSAILRFPNDRVAQFVVSYAAAAMDQFVVVGDKGSIQLDPSFGYGHPKYQTTTIDESKKTEEFKSTDQFGGEMRYFSHCILNNLPVEPDGEEGFADVRVVEGIQKAIETRQSVTLPAFTRSRRINTEEQIQKLSPKARPPEVNASKPTR